MRKIIICMALLLGMITNSFAQQTDTSLVLTQEDYLKKSRGQKVGSVLLVLTGCTIVLLGSAISALSAGGNSAPSFPIVPVVLGGGFVVGGAALSKASARNKQMALDASAHINLPNVSYFPLTALSKPGIPFPAFTIKLNLH